MDIRDLALAKAFGGSGSGSEAEKFVVTFTNSGSNISADKTFEEIMAAIDEGKVVEGVLAYHGNTYFGNCRGIVNTVALGFDFIVAFGSLNDPTCCLLYFAVLSNNTVMQYVSVINEEYDIDGHLPVSTNGGTVSWTALNIIDGGTTQPQSGLVDSSTGVLNTCIQLRHDTDANWARDPSMIPSAGELIFYTTSQSFKIGDGSTTLANLPFLGGANVATKDYVQNYVNDAVASATSVANLKQLLAEYVFAYDPSTGELNIVTK